jgi:hypothetical protein
VQYEWPLSFKVFGEHWQWVKKTEPPKTVFLTQVVAKPFIKDKTPEKPKPVKQKMVLQKPQLSTDNSHKLLVRRLKQEKQERQK